LLGAAAAAPVLSALLSTALSLVFSKVTRVLLGAHQRRPHPSAPAGGRSSLALSAATEVVGCGWLHGRSAPSPACSPESRTGPGAKPAAPGERDALVRRARSWRQSGVDTLDAGSSIAQGLQAGSATRHAVTTICQQTGPKSLA
jgi:hypothetical protein